ncbi:MAG: YbjN domain-containing protein [Anaerolineae bacterium]|nr:YbjN domain-containing protein [Anaerolineae bacterium]
MNHVGSEVQNGQQAFATLGTFLAEDGWYPQQIEERTIYRVGFEGKNGRYSCFAQIRLDLEQFLFYAIAPTKAPEAARAAVAEFLTRANYGLRIGNFEMDYSDGEVRYKSSLDFEGALLTPALIRNAIYPAVQTLDRYLPGFMSVIYGGQTPEAAIQTIEGDAA